MLDEPSFEDNKLSNEIIGAALHVHTVLGPGLLEKIYEECLCHVLLKRGLVVQRQKSLPILFEDIKLDGGLKLDLVVGRIIVELKTVEKFVPIHEAQLHTYLKLSGYQLGLLLNFNVHRLKDGGIKRIIMTNPSLRS